MTRINLKNKMLLGGVMLLAAAGMAGCGSSGGKEGGGGAATVQDLPQRGLHFGKKATGRYG